MIRVLAVRPCLLLAGVLFASQTQSQNMLYPSPAYKVFADKVTQGSNEAKALSATHLVSNYKSPANLFQSADITFKFSLNGRDNEMMPGKDHHFSITTNAEGKAVTPLIAFGEQLNQPASGKYLQPNTPLTIRLDMREVLKQFNEKGFFTAFNGDKIYKEDFKGVFVAGGTAPLIWDFDNLANHHELQLLDEDKDGIYEVSIVLNKQSDEKHTDAEWQLSKDISPYPQYKSDYVLSDAIYNLSLEEMIRAVEADSTFRTGKEWGGVWTRDISYSIILSMAHLQPRVAMNSLMRKVSKKKKIIQDTGTGGAWPCSTDRMIWAVAAWEVYKATGDKTWLENAYEIVRNSIEDDLFTAYDPATGLVKGESSFLDWREQTYPKWMQPADIFESECLGTNAVHFQANVVLSKMATALRHNDVATKHQAIANRIKSGINQYLWMPDKGYYAQFLYGRTNKLVSPRSEALGEALCVIFGIADPVRAKQVIAKTPVTAFGIPCIYPEIPNIPPYHNNGVWPFVQTYWLWAAAATGNEQSVMESIAAIYRPAALWLTNKENFVAQSGDYNGTQINSSIMLWSLSGNISIVQKVLFGIRFHEQKLSFEPYVPKAMKGTRTLTNFKYRNAVLDITLQGFGNKISSILLDGKKMLKPEISATLTGQHTIKIVLNNVAPASSATAQSEVVFTPAAPAAKYEAGQLSWLPIENATAYQVLKNGKLITSLTATSYPVEAGTYAAYQVIALSKNNIPSFASEPVVVVKEEDMQMVQAETIAPAATQSYKGFSGDGFVEISNTVNQVLSFEVTVSKDGMYAIDFRYANGNGPTNTENKCAIRTMSVDDKAINAIVFPQRGKEEWSNWGFSNSLTVPFSAGRHRITLSLQEPNDNMNGDINQAMVDYLRVTKL